MPADRIHLHPDDSTAGHLEEIAATGFPHPGLRDEYLRVASALVERISPLFDTVEPLRIHGDAHAANLLHRPGEALHLIDFDDMAVGPAVQDLWMLLPGTISTSRPVLDALLDGYSTFRDFDPAELRLIEPLRGMRFIHFTAWCARQKRDGGFARLSPDWGTAAFWRQETADLARQLREIEDALG